MKKLLIFVLVLGMASLANAAIVADIQITGSTVTQVEPGDTVDVLISNDTAAAGGTIDFKMFANHAENGSAALVDSWALPPSPVATITSDGTGGLIYAFGGGTAGFNVTGTWLKATFDIPSGTAPGTLTLTWSGTLFGGAPPTGNVPIVPEPMTIALLGLGGLFLVRRRT